MNDKEIISIIDKAIKDYSGQSTYAKSSLASAIYRTNPNSLAGPICFWISAAMILSYATSLPRSLEGTLSAHENIAREQFKQLIEGKILVHSTSEGLEAELHAKTPEFFAKSMGKEFGLVVAGAGCELEL